MQQKIAVAFVHGIEIDDPDYAATAIALLRRRFFERTGVDADEALAIRAVYWSDVVQTSERELLYSVIGSREGGFFGYLRSLVTKINAGSQLALLPFGLAALARWLPGLGSRHYPALRWVITDFVGDAIGYQITPGDRRIYDQIHAKVADALHALACDAGDQAPLCVIAHSLGSVIASDFLYDLETGLASSAPRPRASDRGAPRSALERGETFAHFYTLGSPLALWTLRYPDFGTPITVPAPALARRHPGLAGEWVNFFDEDDLAAYPLRGLGPKYAQAVTEDRPVRIRGLLVSWNPLVHPFYWNDLRVIDPIADALARTWRFVNAAPQATEVTKVSA